MRVRCGINSGCQGVICDAQAMRSADGVFCIVARTHLPCKAGGYDKKKKKSNKRVRTNGSKEKIYKKKIYNKKPVEKFVKKKKRINKSAGRSL